MNTKFARLLILVLVVFLSCLSSKTEAEDYYYSASSYSPESGRSGSQGSEATPPNNYSSPVAISLSSYSLPAQVSGIYNSLGGIVNYPNSSSSSMAVSSSGINPVNLNSLTSLPIAMSNNGISSATLNSYNNPMVVSSTSYNLPTQSVAAYNNIGVVSQAVPINSSYQPGGYSGSTWTPPSVATSDGGRMAVGPVRPEIAQAYNSAVSAYSSSGGNNMQSDIQRAQAMYNNVAANIYNSPIVKQAESSGLVVERSGGYGQNPMTGSPVAYAQVDISSYNPVINAATSALNQGHREVLITGDGVLTGNPIQGNSRSIVIDNNKPTLIGPNNAYNMYRSTADLAKDISMYNANVAATTYRPALVTQMTSTPTTVNQARVEKINPNPTVEMPKFSNK